MNQTPKTLKCGRCRATGFTNFEREGGVCFRCDGKGFNYADKFVDTFGIGGRFFGVSFTLFGSTTKIIQRAGSAESILRDAMDGTQVTQITEEQARAFFAKYGKQTTVPAK